MSGKFYGASNFNPRLITTQIVVMQSSFWLCFGTVAAIADWVLGEAQSAGQLFEPEAYTFDTQRGLALALSLWVTALLMAFQLCYVVERAKKCLDFVATYHIFHLLATGIASGFPSFGAYFHWWVIQVLALVTSVLLGEYMCMRAETKAITLNSKPSKPKASKSAKSSPARPTSQQPEFDEI
ncbi:unnamed protein product [Polarella glacialis]|uniref:Protein SYS1 homolog n=1 Tax=Polarella glacialis TaxID=89957 RepID=A0A813FFW1_POLGL|nr:unnamed protein product [Polarella glacialis]CAE8657805.1 unnamed protein product [Polarella glacialis]|mmetsp:Transcript_47371/g.85337  ORF Transcript_47371/g.85337 Transcript_47371/m.85337 type:complete len:182 (-) Transcript_47371:11-556(-)